jgi:hypothetical protein
MKNEPAFPTKINTEHFSRPSTIYNTGMTLRDYFAAKAMQEFLDEVGSQSDQAWFDQIAKNAYRMADTMLKARQA